MRRSLCFFVALAASLAVSADGSAQPEEPATSQAWFVVPFGVDGIGSVKLAAALTNATTALFADNSIPAQVAMAPRVDILTLIECPSGGDDCIGNLASTLGVDHAIIGEVSEPTPGRFVATVVIATGTGSHERVVIELAGTTADDRAESFRRALAPRVGVTLPPRAADVPVRALLPGPRSPPPPASTSAVTGASGPIDQPGRWSFARVRPVSWIVGGAGAVAFGTGLGFYAMSKSTERDIENAPTLTGQDIAELRDLEATGDRQRTIGGTLLVAGSAATAVGLGLILWDASRPDDEDGIAGVLVAPTAGGAVAVVEGSF